MTSDPNEMHFAGYQTLDANDRTPGGGTSVSRN